MKIKSVLAAVLLGCASASDAFDPTLAAPDFSIIIAGASAPSGALRSLLIRDVCDSAQAIDVFVHGGATKHFNVGCIVNAKKVLFRKNESGSSAGVVSVDIKGQQPFLNLGAAGCGAPVVKTIGTDSYNEYQGCGTTVAALTNLIPDFGLSDVEPDALTSALAPAGQFFQNASALSISKIASLLFGFVVSTDLYRALQAAQFSSSNICNPDPTTGPDTTKPDIANPTLRVPGANGIKDAYEAPQTDSGVAQTASSVSARHTVGDTEKCMPLQSRDEVRSLLARDLTSGNNIWVGPNAADTLTVKAAGKDYAGTGGLINMCRRNPGSGTHAVTAMHFLATNCGKGSFLMPPGTCSDGAGPCAINSSESASGVEACMTTNNSSNLWAVGYQSTEKNADLSQPYRFVKIDGVAPTLNHLLLGNYGHFGELSAVRRGNANDLANVPNADIPAANAIWTTIVNQLSTPANVGSLDALDITKQPFGASGYAARGTPSFPISAATPINPLTHTRPGTTVQNTCTGPFASPVGAGTGKGVAN